jgi:hypothetical protein
MKQEDAFPSRFIKTEDLKGRPRVLEIERVIFELLKGNDGDKEKPVAYFKGHKKALVLNVTNFGSIKEITGEPDSDDWIGSKIELYPDQTFMAGKKTDCIRVRAPGQKASAKTEEQSGGTDMDDGIPFAPCM